jgi:hypothetical protein
VVAALTLAVVALAVSAVPAWAALILAVVALAVSAVPAWAALILPVLALAVRVSARLELGVVALLLAAVPIPAPSGLGVTTVNNIRPIDTPIDTAVTGTGIMVATGLTGAGPSPRRGRTTVTMAITTSTVTIVPSRTAYDASGLTIRSRALTSVTMDVAIRALDRNLKRPQCLVRQRRLQCQHRSSELVASLN